MTKLTEWFDGPIYINNACMIMILATTYAFTDENWLAGFLGVCATGFAFADAHRRGLAAKPEGQP